MARYRATMSGETRTGRDERFDETPSGEPYTFDAAYEGAIESERMNPVMRRAARGGR